MDEWEKFEIFAEFFPSTITKLTFARSEEWNCVSENKFEGCERAEIKFCD